MQKSKQKFNSVKEPQCEEDFGVECDCDECLLKEFLDGYQLGYEDCYKETKNTLAKGIILGGIIIAIAWLITIL